MMLSTRTIFRISVICLLGLTSVKITPRSNPVVGLRGNENDRRVCPELPQIDPNGTWSVTTANVGSAKGWTWHPGPFGSAINPKHYTTWQAIHTPIATNTSTSVPASPGIKPGTVSKILRSDNTSLVFYGSSHVREIFFAMMRLEMGLELAAALPENITFLPSGAKFKDLACDPKQSGIGGLFGVDMDKCGVPARKIIHEISPKVAFGFKTFLHTPDADDNFLHFLTEKNIRHPDILVMDAGIWGSRGNRLGGSTQTTITPTEEWQYYMGWTHESFPQSHVILVHEGHPSILERFRILAQNTTTSQQRVSILRKDILLQKRPQDMPCGHGCSGPVVHTLAVQLVEWMQQRSDARLCIY